MVGPTGILGRHQELPSLPCARPGGSCLMQGAQPSLPPASLPCAASWCPGSCQTCSHSVTPTPPRGRCPLLCSYLPCPLPSPPDTVASWFLTPTWMTVSSLSHQLQAGRDGLSHCRPLVPSLSLRLVGAFASMCRREESEGPDRCLSACHLMPGSGFSPSLCEGCSSWEGGGRLRGPHSLFLGDWHQLPGRAAGPHPCGRPRLPAATRQPPSPELTPRPTPRPGVPHSLPLPPGTFLLRPR